MLSIQKLSLWEFDTPQFCGPHDPERQCQTCFANHNPPYDASMNGFPKVMILCFISINGYKNLVILVH